MLLARLISPLQRQTFQSAPERPIVILSRFQTPAPNKAFQPFWLGKPHEMVGVLDDNLLFSSAFTPFGQTHGANARRSGERVGPVAAIAP
jgi:hypothetical protein